VLDNIDLYIEQGEKIAFVGKNGEGKTTLARIIMNELEHEGLMRIGHNVKIGYFAQNQADLMDGEVTILDTIDRVAVGEIRTKIRDILGAFMFSGDDVEKKVKVLSGGERSRLAMIRLMLEPVNFLVLDEPTNHLDMLSKEILKQALKDFNGTVLMVSHDREFLDGLATCVYEFRDKKIKQHLGGIYDFIQKKKIDSLKELEVKAKAATATTIVEKIAPSAELTFEEQKEINKQIKKLEKQVESFETEIASLESKIAEMDALLSQADTDHTTIYREYERVKHSLEKTMYEWELTIEQMEEWQNKKTW
jgi:ATP-binding cassette subfamily F protein 3